MYVHASALYTCRHVRSCCMQLKFPGGGPADPLLVRLWLGKAGARCPNIAGQGKVLGLCRFLRKRSGVGPVAPSVARTLVRQGRRALPGQCRARQTFGTLLFSWAKVGHGGEGAGVALLAYGCQNCSWDERVSSM
jgi:hypothetical protein